MKSGKSASGGASKEQVKAVQEALKEKGVDPGPADGVMGPKTRQALREYQKKEGLKASGTLDSETMAKLGVQKAGASDSSSPSASPSTGSSGAGASGSSSTSPSSGSTGATTTPKK
jgi:peptidoglycan hydrolase-like protein with peptidoglycan-binding domain